MAFFTGIDAGHSPEFSLGLGLGVDAICSDVPALVQESIERKKGDHPTAADNNPSA